MAEQDIDPAVSSAVITYVPTPGVLICDHSYKSYGYRVFRANGAKDWLIIYTLSGEGQFEVGDLRESMRTGDILIIKPGTMHQYAAAESSGRAPWEFMWCHFLPRSSWFPFHFIEAAKGFKFLSVDQPKLRERIASSFHRMIRDNRGHHFLSAELSLNALEEILLLLAQMHRTSMQHKIDQRVQSVLDLFTEHLKEPHSLQTLSEQVCLSPSRLSHLFRAQTGHSVQETLMHMRLHHAAKLLEFTNRSVSDIAWDAGFKNPFYFTKQFTAFFGKNPSTFRKEAQASHANESTID